MTSLVESVGKKVECSESMEVEDKAKKSSSSSGGKSKKKDPTPAETAARQKKQQAEKEKKQKQQQQQHAQPRRHRNKKQSGSWKKLDVDINFNKPSRGSNGSSGNPGSKRRGGKSRGGEKGRGRGSKGRASSKAFKSGRYVDGCKHYHPELQLQDALRQIEYFFSTQELSRNPYIRSNMDSNGYIPAAIIFNFPSVANYCIPYQQLLNALHASSQTLVVDSHNQTLRLKHDWQRWLYPNPDGTLGCAPWIICTEQQQPYDNQDTTQRTDQHSQHTEHDHSPDDNDSSNNSSASTHPCTDSDAEST